jgi:hypothetical protein
MQALKVLSTAAVDPRTDPQWAAAVPAAMKRRDARIWQLAFAAAKPAIDAAGSRPQSVVVATALGALDETAQFLDGVFKDGFGSPRNFIASVHNSMAGKLAMEFKITGPNLTICEGANSFASAVAAATLLAPAEFPVLLVVVDEEIELLRQLTPHLSAACRHHTTDSWADGAVAFMLDRGVPHDLPRIAAAGPQPVAADSNPTDICNALAAAVDPAAVILSTLARTSATYIAPAQSAHAVIADNKAGCCAIGSYSPTSDAAAVVVLWN